MVVQVEARDNSNTEIPFGCNLADCLLVAETRSRQISNAPSTTRKENSLYQLSCEGAASFARNAENSLLFRDRHWEPVADADNIFGIVKGNRPPGSTRRHLSR